MVVPRHPKGTGAPHGARGMAMSAAQGSYAPEEFVEKLRTDDFDAPPLTFVGMAKPGRDDRHLLFASGTDCEEWTELPLEVIERVEVGELVSCRDHAHPLVKLHLKQPGSEEASAYAALAKAQARARAAAAPAPPPRPAAAEERGRWPFARAVSEHGAAGPLYEKRASRESCLACFRFCEELVQTPELGDIIWCLRFCGPLCPG
jgi:hypothetical protein